MITAKDRALLTLKLKAKAKLAPPVYPVSFEAAACDLSELVGFNGPISMTPREKIDHTYGTEFDILVKMPNYWIVYSVDEDGEGSILSAYDDPSQVAMDIDADPAYYDDNGDPVHNERSLTQAFTRRIFDITFPNALAVYYRSCFD